MQGLINDAEMCQRKMDVAKAMINGLSGEKERWTEQSNSFALQMKR